MKRWLWTTATVLVLVLAPLGLASPARADREAPVDGVQVSSPAGASGASVSVEDAKTIFDKMASQKDIAFHYVADGCYARAYLMIVRMQKMGVKAGRAWAFPANGGKLHAKTAFMKSGFVDWEYHVAPVIAVTAQGKATFTVIDPSMFKEPVSLAKWSGAQKNTRAGGTLVRVTKMGEAPLLADGQRAQGTGYWPAGDPSEGFAAHAAKMMRKFKLLEPR